MLQAFRFRFAFLGLALSLLSQSVLADDTSTKAKILPCESDTRTLEELLKSDQPWSNKVPKDFMIEQHVERYVTVDPAFSYGLPSTTDPAAKKFGAGIGEDYRETADCKATGPDGTRWIVENTGGYALIYVLESAVLPEPIYDARSVAGNAAFAACLKNMTALQNAGKLPVNAHTTECSKESEAASDKAEKELNYGNK